jgi:hypothetical protein
MCVGMRAAKRKNPDLATTKIGSFYFPNFEEELNRQDYS